MGALGSPSVLPCCGMPANRRVASVAVWGLAALLASWDWLRAIAATTTTAAAAKTAPSSLRRREREVIALRESEGLQPALTGVFRPGISALRGGGEPQRVDREV